MFAFTDLINGTSLAALAESTRTALQNIAPQIQTTWFKQHSPDGAHADVTAISVRTERLSFAMNLGTNKTGRLFVVDATGGAQGLPLDVAAGVQFISIISPAAGSYTLYGIRQVDVQYGDQLFVRRDPRGATTVVIQDRVAASVPIGSEIVVPASSGSYPEYYLQESGVWLPLMYSPGVGTNGVDGWAMFSTTVSA
jgi:hypothetical protein